MSLEQAQIQLGGCVWVGALSEACKLGSVRLRRTLESPGLSWREDPLLTQNRSSSLCQWSQVRGPFLPLPSPQQTAVGVLGTGPGASASVTHPCAPRLQPECQEEEDGGGRMRSWSSCIWSRMGLRSPQEMFSSPSTMNSSSSCHETTGVLSPGWTHGMRVVCCGVPSSLQLTSKVRSTKLSVEGLSWAKAACGRFPSNLLPNPCVFEPEIHACNSSNPLIVLNLMTLRKSEYSGHQV